MKRPTMVLHVSAEADERLRQELEKHLRSLEQQGLMQGWFLEVIVVMPSRVKESKVSRIECLVYLAVRDI